MIPDLKVFKSRRYGKIFVGLDIYEEFWKLFKLDIIPLSINFKPHLCRVEIECFCEAFRELGDEDALPLYEVIMMRVNNFTYIESIKESEYQI